MICVGFQVALFWIDDKKKDFFGLQQTLMMTKGAWLVLRYFFQVAAFFFQIHGKNRMETKRRAGIWNLSL